MTSGEIVNAMQDVPSYYWERSWIEHWEPEPMPENWRPEPGDPTLSVERSPRRRQPVNLRDPLIDRNQRHGWSY